LAESNPAIARTAQTFDGDLDRIDGDDGTQPDTPAAEDDAGLGGENLIAPEPGDGSEEPGRTPLSELAPEYPREEAEPLLESVSEGQTSPAVPELAPTPTSPTQPPPLAPSPAAAPSEVGALEDRGVDEAARPTGHDLLLHRDRVPAPIPAGRSTTAPGTPTSATSAEVGASATADPAARTSIPAGDRGTPAAERVSGLQSPITADSYTVRHGDSLWSIARRMLGMEASVGEIAGEVNRLWELNRDRIATGNPSLLLVGTELEL